MKANVNSLLLFGKFPKHKWNLVTYQLPPTDCSFEIYQELEAEDAVLFDYEDGTERIIRRDGHEEWIARKDNRIIDSMLYQ